MRKIVRNIRDASILAVALLLGTVAKASAQNEPQPAQAIPPVEVIANKVPERPHDIAASIEVFSGNELRARGVTSLKDALALATGVAIAPGGDAGPASAVPEFWGLRELDAFLLVVDGVPWGGAFNPAISTLSLQDVERIEVMRGPAPVTYGATSFVGVIHVVHRSGAESDRSAEIRGGSFGSGAGSAELPFGNFGQWKSRLSGDFERRGFRDDHTSFSRGHAMWRTARVRENGQTWFSADVNILRQEPASPHPREGGGLSTSVPLDANYNPANAFLNENRFAFSGGLERPLLGATWSTMASYTRSNQNLFRGFLVDISNTPNNAAGSREDIEINDFYADTHLVWQTRPQLRFLTGGDALIAGGEGNGATFTYTAPLDGSTQTVVPEPTTFDKDAGSDRRFLGAYGSAEWRPIPQLGVNGGLRLNATTESRGEGAEVTHTRLSGALGAIFGIWERDVDHLRVFANYRNTFKPAAFDFSLAENEGVLDPETSRSYEAGLKVRAVGGRLDFEASGFRMDFENLVTSTIVNNQPALINAGKTRFKGVELESDFWLLNALSARASYSFHDGKFVDFVQEFGGVPTQLAGNRFEMSARHLASAGLTFAPDRGFTGNIVFNYTGDRFLNKRNAALAPAFSTLDAGIGYRTSRGEWRLDGRNLTNRRDAVSESELGDAQYYRMPARTIQTGISVRY